jgi:para-nitrobenzyl esterase
MTMTNTHRARFTMTPTIALLSSVLLGAACAPTTLVTTSLGDIQGLQEDNGTWGFLGIPFAEPPTGDRRWKPPVPLTSLESQPFVADAFGPKCPQLENGAMTGDEDCLHLNVWAPADFSETSNYPVLFYIHGGANILGSTSDSMGPGRPVYTGKFLAGQQDVVVVTAQYRLGPLGFLALPELSAESEHGVPGRGASGNYAYLDQLAALQWVQEHIASFGGDPTRVLVFGQSAGGLNSCTLYASPLARGLFSTALVQSGFCPHRTLDEAEAQHERGVALFDECREAADRLACLRELPVDRVMTTIPGSISAATGTADEGGEGMAYGPVVDGHLLPDAPLALIERGEHTGVPLVLGSTAAEMASETIFPDEVETIDAYEAYIEDDFADLGEEAVATILATYPAADFDTPQQALIQVYTDRLFTTNARLLVRAAAAGSSSPVYRYLFSRHTETPFGTVVARHGIDVPYVFHTISTLPFRAASEDLAFSEVMMASWAAFARTGDPNTPELDATWAPYDEGRDNYLDFGSTVSTGEGLRTERCDMWEGLPEP